MIEGWKNKDNFSTSRHQQIVDAVNAQEQLLSDGDLELYGTSAGHSTVDRKVIRPLRQRIPIKIASALTPAGVYSIKMGKWKAKVNESSVVSLANLFDFPATANAVGIVTAEIDAGTGHALAADKIVFGNLQPSVSNLGKPVVEITSIASECISIPTSFTISCDNGAFTVTPGDFVDVITCG